MRRTPLSLLLIALAFPAAASAAPPANDARTSARPLVLPAKVTGTTQDSTLEADEPGSCESLKGSVYYAVQAPADGRIVVRLAAQGDLDATVDVFRRTRSQLTAVDCDVSGADGRANLEFQAEKGTSYVVRVGQRANSVPGGFTLEAFAPAPPPTAPGPRLPARGVSRVLDQVQNTQDAWSASLAAGTSYRINLAAGDVDGEEGCVSLAVFAPGTKDLENGDPVRADDCGGYLLFTPGPGEGGRYTVLASARTRTAGPQPYHLQVAKAGPDDVAPGLHLGNYAPFRGSLRSSGVDAVDLYRFDIVRRSALHLALGGGHPFAFELLDAKGRSLDGEVGDAPIDRRIGRGRYFVAVTAPGGGDGRYVLTRATRTITRTSIAVDGRRHASVLPGRSTRIGVRTSPRASGPVTITVERFDPLSGWQFARQIRTHVEDGSVSVPFTPSAAGRWRARAAFTGTRAAAPSATGNATVAVEGPLRDR